MAFPAPASFVPPACNLALLTAQQHCYGFGKGQAVKPPYEVDGIAAAFRRVIVPLVPADGDAVIGIEPLVTAAGEQLLAAPLEKIHEVHIVGSELLLVGEVNINAHESTSYLWRLPMR
jgi:hypothetical protein